MQLGLREESAPGPAESGKPRALAVSLGLHIAGFFGLMYIPPFGLPALPPASPTEYQQAFAGKEDKIVWYRFRSLPAVVPAAAPRLRRPVRAEVKAKQSIVSSSRNAPKRRQVVLTPAPAVDLPPLDLPNLIAVKLPPKRFTTPPDVVRAEAPKMEATDAPEIPLPPLEAAKLPADRLPARAYRAPPTAAKPLRPAARIELPGAAPEYQEQSTTAARLPATRLPARPYVPPAAAAPRTVRQIAEATEAPAVAMNTPQAARMPGVRLPARAFRPPPAPPPGNRRSVAAPVMEGTPADVTLAVASLNPVATRVTLPAASSPAQFSAGEKVRPDGEASDAAAKGITVPDLFAHPAEEPKPDLLAMTYGGPASKELLDDVMKYHQPAAGAARTAPAPATRMAPAPTTRMAPAGATKVAESPDPRLSGRDIYLMAIQMPNLTSYSGSWLMWYAARSARQTEAEPIAAPVPHRKVDPKYFQDAVEERTEGRVQLFCVIGRDGTVSSIELIKGIDDRLNRSAEEALSKWEFYPATRNGQPVDVDVVVEIPFLLAPRAAK